MKNAIENWLKFLRQYGPIARNDNMYDETILRSARRSKLKPIEFRHPFQDNVVSNFTSANPVSIILTGTAGDGKTHLCRQVWKTLNGDDRIWAGDDPYLTIDYDYPTVPASVLYDTVPMRKVRIHVIRDLSGWSPQQNGAWLPARVYRHWGLARSF
jgi:hypothetical protein